MNSRNLALCSRDQSEWRRFNVHFVYSYTFAMFFCCSPISFTLPPFNQWGLGLDQLPEDGFFLSQSLVVVFGAFIPVTSVTCSNLCRTYFDCFVSRCGNIQHLCIDLQVRPLPFQPLPPLPKKIKGPAPLIPLEGACSLITHQLPSMCPGFAVSLLYWCIRGCTPIQDSLVTMKRQLCHDVNH